MEEIRCIGCGSIIQSTDQSKPGFVPSSKLTENSDDIICRRCFRLKNYNEVTPLSITQDDFYRVVSTIGQTNSLVVKIIDIFDIEGSIIPQIAKLTNHNDLILLVNKVDLLPKSVKEAKLIHHLKKIISSYNLKPLSIHIMSALKYQNIDTIIDDILEKAGERDIYIVGATNVGKSTFINTLLKSYADSKKDIITVSSNAGTTLDLIKIPIGDQFIFDTPGILNDIQLTHYLSQKALKVVTPKKEIKPKGYQLNSGQTLFIGGLARVDFVKGDNTSFICYFSEFLNIHRTKLEKADELYKNHVTTLLTPPFEGESFPLKKHTFVLNGNKQDLVLPGLGFITVKGQVTIQVYTKEETTPYIREALI
jgi:ribosome biogenesis GTPase YqeH